MTATSGSRGAIDDTSLHEPARWDPPQPEDALLPPLAQPRSDEPWVSSRGQLSSATGAPSTEPQPLIEAPDTPEPEVEPEQDTALSEAHFTSTEPADILVPAQPAAADETLEPFEPVVRDAPATSPKPPKRKRSRLGVALIDAVGILLVIVAIALVGKGIADRRNASTKESPTSVTPLSLDPNAPPPTQPGRSISGVTKCPSIDGSEIRATSFQKAPPMCIDVARRYRAAITTNKGALYLTLDTVRAPMTVNNFVVLARYHYFDNTVCPRIIPGYLFQCGDPTGKGTGGPGYALPDELPAPGQYTIGSVAMATSTPDSNGSQFFVVLGADGVALPPKYTLFAQLDPSQEAVLAALAAAGTEQGTPTKEPITIKSVVILEE